MIITPNQQYSEAKDSLQAVRDCIAGEPTIKGKSTTYLKNPDSVDQTSEQSKNRYKKYLENAEFDGFPSNTEIEMIGRMKPSDSDFELPEKLSYLEGNSDGSGLPLEGMVEIFYRNLLEAKYHIGLAEMDSLAGVDTELLTVSDLQEMNQQATIKMYTRESLIDWDFRYVDGALRLSLMILKEVEQVRDTDLSTSPTFSQSEVETYLVLGLDVNGEYFQRKFITGDDGKLGESEVIYPEANGQRLRFIPAEIIADEELQAGIVPQGLGYLYPICSAALSRYRVSADYKESLRFMQPTTFTKGWTAQDKDLFKNLNGREYIAFGVGVANNLPNNVEVSIEGLGVQSEPYEKYMADNEKKAQALGASFNTEPASNVSATEAGINDAKETAAMSSIVSGVELGLTKLVSYCGLFMGVYTVEDLDGTQEDIEINLYDDFGRARLTPDEVRAVNETYTIGLLTKDEAIKKLSQGGFTVSEAEALIDEVDESGAPPVTSGDNQDLQ